MEAASIEECLNKIPNKFELSVIVMNRARSILLGAKTDIETTKYSKKSVNKALMEVEMEKLDLDSFKKEVRQNLLVNNLFLKNIHDFSDNDSNDSNNVIDLSLDDSNDISDTEEIEDEEDDFVIADTDVE